MKTIGLLCGLSWRSTIIYLEAIHKFLETTSAFLTPKILLNNLDATLVMELLKKRRLNELQLMLTEGLYLLESAGSDFIGIACNSVHYFFNSLSSQLSIPLINCIESTVRRVDRSKVNAVGVIATSFTCQMNLYSEVTARFNISSLYPDDHEQVIICLIIDRIIAGKLDKKDKSLICRIIDRLVKNGAESIILGCTELGLLIRQSDVKVPLFDSALIHAEEIGRFAISNQCIRSKN